MANAWFSKGLENFGAGNMDWDAHTWKVIGVDHGTDTPVVATDDALDDITVGARVFTSGALSSKTNTNGVLDAADIVITAVSGASIESIVIYKDSGVESTSYLMTYYDTGTGFPLTPNGGDITIAWDSGANKIAAL